MENIIYTIKFDEDYDMSLMFLVSEDFWNENHCLNDETNTSDVFEFLLNNGLSEAEESALIIEEDVDVDKIIAFCKQNGFNLIENDEFTDFMEDT